MSATLYILETQGQAKDGIGLQASAVDISLIINKQAIVSSSSSVPSSKFNQMTHLIRLWADGDGYIEFGPNPTATTSSIPIAAKTAEYFAVSLPDGIKVAFLSAA